MIYLILTTISLVIFLIYNILIGSKFGIPRTLSQSYYVLEDYKKGLGWMFTIMMWIISWLLLPGWLEVSELISTWSIYLRVLPFITIAGLLFVGAAPAFRSIGLEPIVHEVSAKVAAVAALIWCLVVCWKIMYVPIAVMGIVALIAWLTKTWKSASGYWVEMLCFYPTFITIIVEEIMHLL